MSMYSTVAIHRVQQFDASGEFIRMWGYDVVASGEDDKPLANEVQAVTIRAVSGTFNLEFAGETTASLPYNATAGEIEAELNSLPIVEAFGGSVSVSGGPGDASGSNPYLVSFEGGLAGLNLPEMVLGGTNLGRPVGMELSCLPDAPDAVSRGFFEYQWLANGQPIPGATTGAYTLAASDEGKAIQCRVEAFLGSASNRPCSMSTGSRSSRARCPHRYLRSAQPGG